MPALMAGSSMEPGVTLAAPVPDSGRGQKGNGRGKGKSGSGEGRGSKDPKEPFAHLAFIWDFHANCPGMRHSNLQLHMSQLRLPADPLVGGPQVLPMIFTDLQACKMMPVLLQPMKHQTELRNFVQLQCVCRVCNVKHVFHASLLAQARPWRFTFPSWRLLIFRSVTSQSRTDVAWFVDFLHCSV